MISSRLRRPPRKSGRPRLAVIATVAMVGGVGAVGCSTGNAEPSPDAFCATAQQNPDLITNPPLATPEQIDQSIEFYRLMGQLAPIEIAPEWNQLLEAMETANELVPDNPESEQLVAQTAFASELAAVRVKEWMAERCGIDLPITTIVSHSIPSEQPPVDAPSTTPTTTGQTTATTPTAPTTVTPVTSAAAG